MSTDDAATLGLVIALVALWFWYELEGHLIPRRKVFPAPLKWGGKVIRGPMLLPTTILQPPFVGRGGKRRGGMLAGWESKHCDTEMQAIDLMIWKSGETLRDELEKREREKMS